MTIYRVWYKADRHVVYTMLEDAVKFAEDIFKRTGFVVSITTH